MGVPKSTAILVVGMHRSGTSALAGALAKAGIPLGERLLDAGPDNPTGYWEHRDVVAVHERLLVALGSRWEDVRALPPEWLSSEPARRAADELDALIARDFAREPVWAVKDPRLCRLLPLWFEVLARRQMKPVVLLMARRPGEVSASIAARSGWHAPFGEVLWLRYMVEAVGSSGRTSRHVVVYEDLLADPHSAVASALGAAGIAFDRDDPGARRAIVEFVDRSARHHARAPSASGAEFSSIAESAYAALVSIARGSNAWERFDACASEFEGCWQRQGALIDALAAMAASAADSRDKLSADLTAQIAWSNGAREKHEALYAKYADTNSKLIAQIRWSEEAQADRDALREAKKGLAARLTEQERLCARMAEEHNELSVRLQGRSDECRRLVAALESAKEDRAHLQEALRDVRESWSWKLTRPLRAVAAVFGTRAALTDKSQP